MKINIIIPTDTAEFIRRGPPSSTFDSIDVANKVKYASVGLALLAASVNISAYKNNTHVEQIEVDIDNLHTTPTNTQAEAMMAFATLIKDIGSSIITFTTNDGVKLLEHGFTVMRSITEALQAKAH